MNVVFVAVKLGLPYLQRLCITELSKESKLIAWNLGGQFTSKLPKM